MVQQIKHLSDLLKWFSLEKYSEAVNLDALGWCEQLSWRLGMLKALCRPYSNDIWKIDEPSQNISKGRTQALEFARTTPILLIEEVDELMGIYFHSSMLDELRSGNPNYSFSVNLTTVRQHYKTEFNIRKDERIYARNFFAQIFDDRGTDLRLPLKYKYQDWIDKPIDNLVDAFNTRRITVNLQIPDKILLEQFRKLLLEVRKPTRRIGITLEAKTKPDFAAWMKFGLLPYLDLHIWKKETGIKIPNRVVADAIFLPGEGGEEVVRKTTHKIAQEVMSNKYLSMLAAIAAEEVSERNRL
ncbi:MAG: hypothetical protein EBU46_11265 [Nitrosomonadaceae bacterium]|nr:hypothetical protein [Nitrosomonadaceae bacterium]